MMRVEETQDVILGSVIGTVERLAAAACNGEQDVMLKLGFGSGESAEGEDKVDCDAGELLAALPVPVESMMRAVWDSPLRGLCDSYSDLFVMEGGRLAFLRGAANECLSAPTRSEQLRFIVRAVARRGSVSGIAGLVDHVPAPVAQAVQAETDKLAGVLEMFPGVFRIAEGAELSLNPFINSPTGEDAEADAEAQQVSPSTLNATNGPDSKPDGERYAADAPGADQGDGDDAPDDEIFPNSSAILKGINELVLSKSESAAEQIVLAPAPKLESSAAPPCTEGVIIRKQGPKVFIRGASGEVYFCQGPMHFPEVARAQVGMQASFVIHAGPRTGPNVRVRNVKLLNQSGPVGSAAPAPAPPALGKTTGAEMTGELVKRFASKWYIRADNQPIDVAQTELYYVQGYATHFRQSKQARVGMRVQFTPQLHIKPSPNPYATNVVLLSPPGPESPAFGAGAWARVPAPTTTSFVNATKATMPTMSRVQQRSIVPDSVIGGAVAGAVERYNKQTTFSEVATTLQMPGPTVLLALPPSVAKTVRNRFAKPLKDLCATFPSMFKMETNMLFFMSSGTYVNPSPTDDDILHYLARAITRNDGVVQMDTLSVELPPMVFVSALSKTEAGFDKWYPGVFKVEGPKLKLDLASTSAGPTLTVKTEAAHSDLAKSNDRVPRTPSGAPLAPVPNFAPPTSSEGATNAPRSGIWGAPAGGVGGSPWGPGVGSSEAPGTFGVAKAAALGALAPVMPPAAASSVGAKVSALQGDLHLDDGCLVLVDLANVYISARMLGFKRFKCQQSVDINLDLLVDVVLQGGAALGKKRKCALGRAFCAADAGVPEPVSRAVELDYSRRSSHTGREKQVDTKIVRVMAMDLGALCYRRLRTSDGLVDRTYCIISGDGDYADIVKMALQAGFCVELWSFAQARSAEYVSIAMTENSNLRVFNLDDYVDRFAEFSRR